MIAIGSRLKALEKRASQLYCDLAGPRGERDLWQRIEATAARLGERIADLDPVSPIFAEGVDRALRAEADASAARGDPYVSTLTGADVIAARKLAGEGEGQSCEPGKT